MRAGSFEDRTKKDLDRALRQLLDRDPLERIRVRELTDLCGIRRQSFYYHFPDVHALFSWSLERETESLLARRELCLTWRQALADLVRHIGENRRYYQALLADRGREGLAATLSLRPLLERTLTYYRRRGGESPPDEASLECWETLVVTLLESWIRQDLPQPPEALLALLEGALRQGAAGAAWQNPAARA